MATNQKSVNRQRHSFAILVFSGERAEKTQSTGPLSSAIKPAHSRTHRVVFAAPSEEQKRLWLNALNEVIGRERNCEEKSQSHSISRSQIISRGKSQYLPDQVN